MKSEEYREAIRRMVQNGIKLNFPGLRQVELNKASRYIARNIHARFYGANVDSVESPLWRKDEPTIDAQTILDTETEQCGTNYAGRHKPQNNKTITSRVKKRKIENDEKVNFNSDNDDAAVANIGDGATKPA